MSNLQRIRNQAKTKGQSWDETAQSAYVDGEIAGTERVVNELRQFLGEFPGMSYVSPGDRRIIEEKLKSFEIK